MEQLQLEVEEQLFNQDEGSLVQMIEILGIEDDVVGKTKMHKIKIIRKEIDSKLQSDEKQIYMWSQRNRLSIHNGKSEAMLLSTKPLIGPLQELRYEENRIDFVNSTCCLGIEIDNKLSWSPHIDKLCKSYRKKLGALRRMPRLPPKVLEEIYFKTVVSGVSYCIPVWDSGLKRGYKESKIVDALIRAISPHSSLRSYVETLCAHSLAKVRRILRVHYREKAASEAYQQLATVCQQSYESPQQFLPRGLDLRNKNTGAQVSIISNEFLKNFPGVVVKDISESLDTKLNMTAANGSEMPYIGWVELNFRLSSCNLDLKVPFFVTEQCLDSPLIGFNVIDKIIKGSNGHAALSQVITSSFNDLDSQTPSIFVNFFESLNQEELCRIKTTKRDTTIPPKQSLRVTCRVNTGPVGRHTLVLFEPDETDLWPNGLEISETLLTVKNGKSSKGDIDIINNTNHEGDEPYLADYNFSRWNANVSFMEKNINEDLDQEAPGSGTTRPVHPLDEESGVAPMCIPMHIKDRELEDVLQAVACSAESQDQGQVNWVSALTRDHTFLPTVPVGTDQSTVTVIDIRQAQATDQVVRRVSDLTQRGQRSTTGERKQEFSDTQLFLHEWENLSLDKDGQNDRNPGTLLTYNTLGNPIYETQAAAHVISTNSVLGSQLPQCYTPHLTCGAGLPFVHQFQLPTNPPPYQHPVIFGYPITYLQYPLTPQPVFHLGNQYSAYQPVVYQPKDDLMQVPVTLDYGHVPVPGYVY
ncbi:hypothetical protein P5673_029269 [Acropora cervicornis]|uniref:Uncharacterized protein n=1 Tax=Acropora cervicornis TaxID=6130 RepID=A0AAD9UU66_ACRCE|nr:hypothetical protein P5673_029269 [Acropora cervicornis]